MAQSKFNGWVKMLANPLKLDVFDSHPLELLISTSANKAMTI